MGQPSKKSDRASDRDNSVTADGVAKPTGEQPLTLNRLTAALAEMLGPPAVETHGCGSRETSDGEALKSHDFSYENSTTDVVMSLPSSDDCPITPRSVLEALLFVGQPGSELLRAEQVAEWIRDVEPGEVAQAAAELNSIYAEEGAPYAVLEESGGFRLRLTPEFQQNQRRLSGRSREARLSQAAVEVLALVAYNQPIAGSEISRLRGRPSGHVLTHLVRRQLLRIERTADRPRTPLYQTTQRFLTLFGLSDISDLPQTQELEQ